MNLCLYFILLLVMHLNCCKSLPANSNDKLNVSRSVYGQPFDEIIVESSLTVRRKSARQERNDAVSLSKVGEFNRNKRYILEREITGRQQLEVS